MGGSRREVGQGIFPKQHQSRSWRGRACETRKGGKEGKKANGSEEGVDLGREDRKVRLSPPVLSRRRAREACALRAPGTFPRWVAPAVCLLPTAEPAAAPVEEGHSRVRRGSRAGDRTSGGQGTSPCRDWVRFSTYTLWFLRGKGCSEPIGQMGKRVLGSGLPIRGPADKPLLGASHAPFSFDFRLSGASSARQGAGVILWGAMGCRRT